MKVHLLKDGSKLDLFVDGVASVDDLKQVIACLGLSVDQGPIPMAEITPEDITALRQSLEGWRHIMETFRKGEYFTSGWAGKQIESLLARIET